MTPVTLSLVVDRENVQVVSKFLLELFPPENGQVPEPPAEQTKTQRTATVSPKANNKTESTEAEKADENTTVEEKKITLSDVRAKARLLTADNKQEKLKALFKKYNATRLTDIEESVYPALLADLEAEISG